MTSLPISNSKPQPSGNAANALPANIATDPQATDAQSAEPFALLLAQQIGESNLSVPDAAQTAIAIDGNATGGSASQALKDTQDQATAATNSPGDPANTLAAILLQLPALEDRGQKTENKQVAQHLAVGAFQKTEGRQSMQSFVPGSSQDTTGHKKPMTGSENSQIIQFPANGHLSSEAVKRAELPSSLAQPVPNTAQAIVSPTISAAIPGMLTNNTSISAPPTIATPLGNNGWADEFSQKISWISTQQNQVAELHLNPPNLGPLDVVLEISDNQATALFTSPHGAVRDAVENALPKLREILADNGITLGNTTISDQPPRDR
ncbi:MAG TPA: flagellar hook-length control protein FliK, partial [Gallionella sp.]|nr:flagellar hook-length control protein FliK [Gallionella sp.]